MPTYDYVCEGLLPCLRAVPVDDRCHKEDLPDVQEEKAPPLDRGRRRDRLQGDRLLPDRLPQRVVQEGGRCRCPGEILRVAYAVPEIRRGDDDEGDGEGPIPPELLRGDDDEG